MQKLIVIFFLLSIGNSVSLFGQGNNFSESDKRRLPTTLAEYEFMLEGELDFGRQQQYSGANSYNDYIGEYTFRSMDIIEDLKYRYVGTVIIIIDKNDTREIVCIPHLNEKLLTNYKHHLKHILKHQRLAKAYSEFIARRSAFTSALGHYKSYQNK